MSLIKRPATARRLPGSPGIPEALIHAIIHGTSRQDTTYFDILDAIPDGWVKVDGTWHFIPDEHFISVKSTQQDGLDWRMEHSLSCRIRGMADCDIQELWEAHLEEGGWWPNDGRYRLVVTGENTPRDDVFEDTRTIEFEEA